MVAIPRLVQLRLLEAVAEQELVALVLLAALVVEVQAMVVQQVVLETHHLQVQVKVILEEVQLAKMEAVEVALQPLELMLRLLLAEQVGMVLHQH
jgi:hypothetical protein